MLKPCNYYNCYRQAKAWRKIVFDCNKTRNYKFYTVASAR